VTRTAPPPAIRRIGLTDFRNHPRLTLAAPSGSVVLTGPNGAGKTNLLEALSLLVPGRGLRRATTGECARVGGAGDWRVAAEIDSAGGPVAVGTASRAGANRTVEVDGAARRGQAILGLFHSQLWLTPAMDRLFVDAPAGRRRFLDRIVFGHDPDHAGRVARFERALRERGRLLRDGPADPAWLDALEEQMARHGVAVAAARRQTVSALDDALAVATGPFPRAGVAVAGDLETALADRPALAVEDDYRLTLARARASDPDGGGTPGPQRSDLLVADRASGRPAALGSTGEQKALLLAVVLGAARLIDRRQGRPPVLLFDEVAAHLDPRRRADLFAAVAALGTQAWFTGTEIAPFAAIDGEAAFLTLEGGDSLIARSHRAIGME
jgi:DNA replication and repair protein RecF